MTEDYKKLLNEQLKKLDHEDFDFDAWKTSTTIALSRMFGPTDVKIKQLANLRVEYGNSWSMRAVSGSFDPISTAKKQGREIVAMAIKELDLYGEEILNPCGKLIDDALAEVLRMKDYRNLEAILSESDPIVKKESVNKFLKKLSKDELTMVLTAIVIER